MAEVDLSALPWTVRGWRPFVWQWKQAEAGAPVREDVDAVAARVPGSVQQALLDAGVINDWNAGLQSRDCEWIEHRHWEFSCDVPRGMVNTGERVVLDAPGLDYSGWVLVDGRGVAEFCGALVPHRIDLTGALGDGGPHRLSLMFDEPPRENGQMGHTSGSKYFKPRYSYSWDWIPRIVPVGIWEPVRLLSGLDAACVIGGVRTELAENLRTGLLVATIEFEGQDQPSATMTLFDGDRQIARKTALLQAGANTIELMDLHVRPWQPNGSGAAKVYTLEVVVSRGQARWSQRRTVGFRRIEWHACEGAPAGAEPWICVVNGEPTFLQGVNWTPVTAIYHDTTDAQYEKLISLYQEMGCNALRVWGGGYLEREQFYDMCDRAGLLVWQEFPLSSSGLDNWPPEDPRAIKQLEIIARSYIRRRSHHPSLFQWCGGNELQGAMDGGKCGTGKPIDRTHPAMAALDQIVRTLDPGRRFIPTSASGPRFMASPADFGKGLHHDVHGPWGLDEGGMTSWRAYWDGDDALFRSEVGAASPSRLELIRRYRGNESVWPPPTPFWNHTATWWTQWNRFADRFGGLDEATGLPGYIDAFRTEQAEALAYAAARCKERFPRCGGFLVWMGHDCFPMPSNTAIIESDQQPKPAYHALTCVFRSLK